MIGDSSTAMVALSQLGKRESRRANHEGTVRLCSSQAKTRRKTKRRISELFGAALPRHLIKPVTSSETVGLTASRRFGFGNRRNCRLRGCRPSSSLSLRAEGRTPAAAEGPLRGRGFSCWGRNLLSGGVLAGVEGSSSDFGDVLNYQDSLTTRLGPSTPAGTPALRRAGPLLEVWDRGPFESNSVVRRAGKVLSPHHNSFKRQEV